jgi:hypothetical protein
VEFVLVTSYEFWRIFVFSITEMAYRQFDNKRKGKERYNGNQIPANRWLQTKGTGGICGYG